MQKMRLTSFIVFISALLITSLVLNNGVFAGTTGKIQGTIIDSQSSEPLIGVNVIMEGTTFGAATDESGFFFIINIPPGTYQLKASMVGYAVETKENVRVYVDRTTTQDFSLRTSAVAGEEVTVTAERVPVPLDVSQTEAYISGEDVVESPSGRFDELIGYQAGVEYANTSYTQRGRGFSVRGGDVLETDIQMDGISLMNKITSQPAIPLSRNLIQDVQILTGGFNAEYGNIRSGLINVVTKDGSFNRYSGVLEGRYSPKMRKHFGSSEFDQDTENGNEYAILYWGENAYTGVPMVTIDGKEQPNVYHWKNNPDAPFAYYQDWRGFNTYAAGKKYGPKFYYDMTRWQDRPIPYALSPDVMMDFSGGGPVPFLPNTKFYASEFWNRSEYILSASRKHSHEYNSSLKITNRIKSNMTLVLSGFSTFVHGIASSDRETSLGVRPNYMVGDDKYMFAGGGVSQSYNRDNLWNPRFIFEQPFWNPIDNKTHNINLKLTHTHSPATYYVLNFGVVMFESDRHHMPFTDPAIVQYIVDEKTGESVGFDEYPWGYTGRGYKGYGRFDIIGYGHRTWAKGVSDHTMTEFNLRGDIVSQVTKANQIKAGFSLSFSHMNWKTSYNFTNPGNPIGQRPYEWAKWKADPRQLDMYVQDKLEWEGMILNFGLRSVVFSPNTNGMNITDDNIFAYDSNGYPNWAYQGQWGTEEGVGNWMWEEFRTRKLKSRILLQPRIGISHPITESSKIFFNYGHFYTMPNPSQLYSLKAASSMGGTWGSTGSIGIPDLKWPKLVAYEIGYSQSIYNQFLLQISGYYKDYTDEISTYSFQSIQGDVNTTSHFNNIYRDIRGLEFRLERSFGRFINGWANYNYMIRSSGNSGFSVVYEDYTRAQDQFATQAQEKPEALPNFRLNVSLRTPVGWGPGRQILGVKPLAEWRLNLLYRWNSGGRKLMNASSPPVDWYYVNYTNINMWDLYVTKRLARGAQFYVQIQNVFNIKRLSYLGPDYESSLHMWYEDGEQKGEDKIGDYKGDYTYLPYADWRVFMPDKRQWYFGIRYQF